ncbi:MAG TPA: glycosyltransferase family 2 protein [Lacipirellulaceae bacterium]|nr:glycosyltransferase family 2 protein [Lacipirellulaceae bacterium]
MTTSELTTRAAWVLPSEGRPASAPPLGAGTALLGVSVVVPMFNEAPCVDALVASLETLHANYGRQYDLEFLLVDDGSTDDTVVRLQAAVAHRPRYRILRHGGNRGIAAAIQTGLRAARHEVAASMDCDGSYDAGLLAQLVPLLAPGVDLVTASPYHVDGAVQNVPLWRLRLSRLASQLYGLACWRRLSCYTSCFRVYRRSSVAPLELEYPGFVGVAELLCQVLERGGHVVEHPALLRSRVAGHSKMRVIRASRDHLRLMASILVRRALRRRALAAPAARSSPGTS